MSTRSPKENARQDGAANRLQLGAQAWLLRGFLLETPSGAAGIADDIAAIISRAPFRQMFTPGGKRMSVALTNCGALGWTSDRRGYRYTSQDPDSGEPWPPMPESFLRVANGCALEAGFTGFEPDACLINRYEPGARLSLHRDQDERDFDAPIVSVSLGLGAVFLFGGLSRSDRPDRVLLEHGDVVVWGGVDRLRYHGVMPLKESTGTLFDESLHPLLLRHRINLTFRKAA